MKKQTVRKRKKYVQQLLGLTAFTRYGLQVGNEELLFFQISPTNISVLSYDNISLKIQKLTTVLSCHPNIEIICADSSQCFDANKAYLQERLETEENTKVRSLLKKDYDFLNHIQEEISSARQFVIAVHTKDMKSKQIFDLSNNIEQIFSKNSFNVKRMEKEDIKRFLALYFEAAFSGEQIPDIDGAQYLIPGNDDEEEETGNV